MKKILLAIVVVVALLVAIIAVNTARNSSKQIKANPVEGIKIDKMAAAKRLSGAVKCKTISYQDFSKFDLAEFEKFREFLKQTFPHIHTQLSRELVNGHSLLYTWKGSDPNLKPAIFTAHIDVVPIAPGTMDDWTHPPFSGDIDNEFIWGRGTLDDKVSLVGIMEAVENLLAKGFQPKRTIYLAFGHDEEVSGQLGALEIVKLMKSRNIKAEYLIDESGLIMSGMVPGVSKPVALIGIAEKGYMTLELTAKNEGGHSAMPGKNTAIGTLATAIHNLEKNQFPTRASGSSMLMFDYVGPEMPTPMKALFANRWLFKPIIVSQLKNNNATYASIHTTTSVTVINAGEKENVLPQEAKALVNFRILPGDDIDYVIDYVKKSIDNPDVSVEIGHHIPSNPSPVTSVDSYGFKTLHKTIAELCPDVIVAPYLVMAATDAKHYAPITDCIIRFFPGRLEGDDLKRIHGTNERVRIDNYEEIVQFYAQMIVNSN